MYVGKYIDLEYCFVFTDSTCDGSSGDCLNGLMRKYLPILFSSLPYYALAPLPANTVAVVFRKMTGTIFLFAALASNITPVADGP